MSSISKTGRVDGIEDKHATRAIESAAPLLRYYADRRQPQPQDPSPRSTSRPSLQGRALSTGSVPTTRYINIPTDPIDPAATKYKYSHIPTNYLHNGPAPSHRLSLPVASNFVPAERTDSRHHDFGKSKMVRRHTQTTSNLAYRDVGAKHTMSMSQVLEDVGDQPMGHMIEINIGVLSSADAGKKHFLHHAFDIIQAGGSPTRKTPLYALNRFIYTVHFFDIPLHDIRTTDEGQVRWPVSRNNVKIPSIHATILIYDVTKPTELSSIPEILNALKRSILPVALVPSRSIQYASIRTQERDLMEARAKSLCDGIDVFHMSDAPSEIQNRCVAALLLRHVGEEVPALSTSTISRTSSSKKRAPAHTKQPRSRTDSKVAIRSTSNRIPLEMATNGQGGSSPVAFEHVSRPCGEVAGEFPQRSTTPLPVVQPPATLDGLVHRLLNVPTTKADATFPRVFLLVYRMFVAPSQLLHAIITHSDRLCYRTSNPSNQRNLLERHLRILDEWICSYPSDHAHPTSQEMLRQFLSDVCNQHVDLITLVEQIHIALGTALLDNDTEWACSDSKLDPAGAAVQGLVIDTAHQTASPRIFLDKLFGLDEKFTFGSQSTILLPGLAFTCEADPQLTKGRTVAKGTPLLLLSSSLTSPVQKKLTKDHWNLVMTQTEENIAHELARTSSALFVTLQPRDLLRQATHPSIPQNYSSSVSSTPLSVLTRHFNRIAYWTSSLILLRNTPKQRALILTKFMRVARKVRELNDYNTLAALIAGIQGTSVHRLRATWELLAQEVRRDFLKLEVLMSNSRTNASYRMAWENTRKDRGRCPFLAIHQRDLLAAVAGGKTFVDVDAQAEGSPLELRLHLPKPDIGQTMPGLSSPPGPRLINWQKFHIIGNILMSIQAMPYAPSPVINEEIRALIMDTQIIEDEDELYARSCAIEPTVVAEFRLAQGVGADRGIRGWVGRFGRGT